MEVAKATHPVTHSAGALPTSGGREHSLKIHSPGNLENVQVLEYTAKSHRTQQNNVYPGGWHGEIRRWMETPYCLYFSVFSFVWDTFEFFPYFARLLPIFAFEISVMVTPCDCEERHYNPALQALRVACIIIVPAPCRCRAYRMDVFTSITVSLPPTTTGTASSMSSSPITPAMPMEGAKTLQQRLNVLLSKLSRSIDIVKNWPSTDGDDASDHVKTTSTLIASILEIKSSLENVEGTLKANAELRKALQNCPIPINLLDLLDHGNGLNPGTLASHDSV